MRPSILWLFSNCDGKLRKSLVQTSSTFFALPTDSGCTRFTPLFPTEHMHGTNYELVHLLPMQILSWGTPLTFQYFQCSMLVALHNRSRLASPILCNTETTYITRITCWQDSECYLTNCGIARLITKLYMQPPGQSGQQRSAWEIAQSGDTITFATHSSRSCLIALYWENGFVSAGKTGMRLRSTI